MKKIIALLLAVVLTFGLVACQEDTTTTVTTTEQVTTTTVFTGPLVNSEKDYYVTGNFNGWDTVADTGMMEAVSEFDTRLEGLDLDGVEYIYLKEIVLPAEEAGWGVNYIIGGVNTSLDGNLTVKVIRTLIGDADSRDWWAQSPESGAIVNLTPETLFIPEYVEAATTSVVVGEGDDAVTFTTGGWNDNPAALAAGTYYAVFAEYTDGTRALGLVVVPA